MEIFVKVKGIDGVATNDAWKQYHKVSGFGWGVSNTQAVGSETFGGGGKANISDVTFSKVMDNTSPQFMQKCVLGDHIEEVEICFAAGAQQKEKFLTIKLNDCIISSYNFGGSGSGDDVPTETISIGTAKFNFDVGKLDTSKGKVAAGSKFGYDLKTMKSA